LTFFKHFFLTRRFFYGLAGFTGLFAGCHFLPEILLFFVQTGLGLYLIGTLADAMFLFSRKKPFQIQRQLASVFSLGSDNGVRVTVENKTSWPFKFWLLDELPYPFQNRDFRIDGKVEAFGKTELNYVLVPKTRGLYSFGQSILYFRSPIGLVERRIEIQNQQDVRVFPSLVEMKKYQLMASQRISTENGIRKIRRLGHSYDFDHIKDYARGDDPRTINWKATGKLNRLMVNHFEDEKSQQVYTIIDLGRNMSSPFEGMSLLDYAVNACLSLSALIIKKDDKAGLLGIGDKTHQFVAADKGTAQLGRLMHSLYNLKETEGDPSFDRMYQLIRTHIRVRSLIIYFTNVESLSQLERILPTLERIQSRHLLVVVLFENAEIQSFAESKLENGIQGVYEQTIARKYLFEKQQMVHRLRRSGIYTILTQPRQLTVRSVNQYLELKARGLI
jgi:uncharacterized protein (DUF58 family)